MIWQLYCCLTALCVYRQINSYQPPSGYLSVTWSASGRSARDLRRQQAQGVPKACKKAGFAPTGAVCRSCTTMPVAIRAPPTRRENRNGFPGSQVFGTGTLPVGFQGRSALVAPKGAKSPMRTGARRIIHSEWLEPSSEAVLSTRARSGRPTPFDRRNGRLWPAGRRPLRSSGRDIPEFFRYVLSGLPSVR